VSTLFFDVLIYLQEEVHSRVSYIVVRCAKLNLNAMIGGTHLQLPPNLWHLLSSAADPSRGYKSAFVDSSVSHQQGKLLLLHY
jgi:hypothetical protein